MKKTLQLLWGTALMAAALPAMAQEAADVFQIQPGENQVTEAGSVNFAFTATETGLATLTGMSVSAYGEPVTATYNDETWSVTPYASYMPKVTAFYVEEGVTYTFTHSEYSAYDFTYDLAPVSGSLTGESCAEPMDLPTNTLYLVPGSGGYSSPAVVYAALDVPFDGKLKLEAYNSMQKVEVGSGCDGTWTELSYEYAYPYYIYSTMGVKGEKLMVRMTASEPVLVNTSFYEVLEGGTCDDAFTAVMGENSLPAAAGTYWYKITTPSSPSNGVLKVSSDANASAELRNDCTSQYNILTSESVSFRTVIYANNNRYLKVVKDVATADPESISISFTATEPIDERSQGEVIQADTEITLPEWQGTYYYSIKTPAEPKLLCLTSDAGEDWAGNFSCTELNGYTQLGSGKEFKAETAADKTYMIQVTVPAGNEVVKFSVSFEEMEQGAVKSFPFEAKLGANDMPAFGTVYYTFSPDVDKLVELSTDVEGTKATVSAPNDYGYENDVPLISTEAGYKFEAVAGKTYSIAISNVTAAGTLTITEVAYAPGESWNTAYEPSDATVAVPAGPGKTWYLYTADTAGLCSVSTTVPGNYSSAITVYVGEVDEANAQKINAQYDWSSGGYAWDAFKCAVEQGQKVYVCINNSESTGGDLTVTFAPAAPGEASNNPIAINFNGESLQFEFPKATDSGIWYSIELTEGIFNLKSSSDFTMDMYAPGNTKTPVTSAQWQYNDGDSYTAISNYGVTADGTYLLYLSRANAAFNADITLRAPAAGETPATAYVIDIKGDPTTAAIEAISGSASAPVWYKMHLGEGILSIVAENSGYLYASFYGDDFMTPIANTQSFTYGDSYAYGIEEVEIPVEGWYYLQVKSSNGNPIVLSGTAVTSTVGVENISAEAGELFVAAGKVVNNSDAAAAVYDLNGRLVANVAAGQSVSLNAGLYVVSNGKLTFKAIVK